MNAERAEGGTLLATSELGPVFAWITAAFYPALLIALILPSFGLPIPEDVPLLSAGVLLRTQPQIATWTGTIAVALLGIAIADTILYGLGRRFGPGVVRVPGVRSLVTPRRFVRARRYFRRWGLWFCFGGRFVAGARAMMCLTAGATRLPYWKFVAVDMAAALIHAPLIIGLGYTFASIVPVVQRQLTLVQSVIVLGAVIVVAIVMVAWHRRAKRRVQRGPM